MSWKRKQNWEEEKSGIFYRFYVEQFVTKFDSIEREGAPVSSNCRFCTLQLRDTVKYAPRGLVTPQLHLLWERQQAQDTSQNLCISL